MVNIVLHALLAWLVERFLQHEGLSMPHLVAASLVMITSQANAAAILQNDTTSQIAGTYLGCITLWLIYRKASQERTDGVPLTHPLCVNWGALATFVLSLLSKESSLDFLPMVGVLFLVTEWRNHSCKQRLVHALLKTIPYLAIVGLYFAVRGAIGFLASLEVDDYRTVRLGPNVLISTLRR